MLSLPLSLPFTPCVYLDDAPYSSWSMCAPNLYEFIKSESLPTAYIVVEKNMGCGCLYVKFRLFIKQVK